MTKNIVSYIRVSTKKQGQSGLGLEAQQHAVAEYAKANGLKVVKEYVEVESGRKAARPQLLAAISHARASKATLVVAKLDRLARNVSFTSALMESGVKFVCCDMPTANEFTIHILAAVAQQEAKAISERTKNALAAAKRRGVKLGSHRDGHWEGETVTGKAREARRQVGIALARKRSASIRSKAAADHNQMAVKEALELRKAGHSWQHIADTLNDSGFVTRRGNSWSVSSIYTAVKKASAVGFVLASGAGEAFSVADRITNALV